MMGTWNSQESMRWTEVVRPGAAEEFMQILFNTDWRPATKVPANRFNMSIAFAFSKTYNRDLTLVTVSPFKKTFHVIRKTSVVHDVFA
jgi:hypothetical protein